MTYNFHGSLIKIEIELRTLKNLVDAINADTARFEFFLSRLLNPEDLGHAVTAEVRDEVRGLLGMDRVETKGVKP